MQNTMVLVWGRNGPRKGKKKDKDLEGKMKKGEGIKEKIASETD